MLTACRVKPVSAKERLAWLTRCHGNPANSGGVAMGAAPTDMNAFLLLLDDVSCAFRLSCKFYVCESAPASLRCIK
jgi:hypothetical protein